MASQSLLLAKAKGLKVDDAKLRAVHNRKAAEAESEFPDARSERPEQLSRTDTDRRANAREIGR